MEEQMAIAEKAHKFVVALCDLIEEHQTNSGEFISCIADILAFAAVKNDAEDKLRQEFLEMYSFWIDGHKREKERDEEMVKKPDIERPSGERS